MEQIKDLNHEKLFEIAEPTFGAFIPLLEANVAKIKEIPTKTFQYGPTKRHQLDIYYPIAPNTSGKTKILVWLYGGGFVSGERQLAPPANLAYACVGAYFAHQGFITIIPDYRLVPEAVYPGPAEDARDAVLWAINNPQHLTTSNTPNPDTKDIFLMGHSAGAVHAFTTLVLPETDETKAFRSSIGAAILCGAMYHAEGLQPDMLMDFVSQHYGGAQGVKERVPIALFQNASDATVAALPRTLVVMAEHEPRWLINTGDAFMAEFEKRTGKKLPLIWGKGHNHVSLHMALSTGEGEDWAREVVKWIGA